MLTADTLQADTVLISQLRQNPDYAYAVGEERQSLLRLLWNGFWDGFNSLFGLTDEIGYTLKLVVSSLVVALFLWWVVRRSGLSRFFARSGRLAVDLDEAERDIHAIDFARELSRALAAADYTRACRLLYLQTLKRLADAGRIDWQPSKTPTQYASEYTLDAFRQLTTEFLRVRYGNFPATADTYQLMLSLQQQVAKGGAQ